MRHLITLYFCICASCTCFAQYSPNYTPISVEKNSLNTDKAIICKSVLLRSNLSRVFTGVEHQFKQGNQIRKVDSSIFLKTSKIKNSSIPWWLDDLLAYTLGMAMCGGLGAALLYDNGDPEFGAVVGALLSIPFTYGILYSF